MAGFGVDRHALAASSITIGGWFRSQVMVGGRSIAIQQGAHQLTYLQLNERVNRLANSFHGRGLRRGDSIAVLSENRHE
jgi:acyl-CoA synthetase (AMP-forming)/AMP-acid ligase II